MLQSAYPFAPCDLQAPASTLPEQGGTLGRRLKVLVSAYACSPYEGSEAGVGWGWVQAISRYHDLWVLTGQQFRGHIEAELRSRPELRDRLRFHYIPRTRHLAAERIWPPAYLYTYKHQWQKDAYQAGKQLHEQIGFDIVHQLTYVGFRVPGYLWKLGLPFVWGPIGGLEQTTWSLIPSLGLRGGLHSAARNLFNDWDRRFAQLPKQAFAAADGGIIAATRGIQREIHRFYRKESHVICEIGLPPITQKEPCRRPENAPLHLLWCGNLNPRKALPFLFSALKMLPPKLDWRLTVIGDGPCSASWQSLARRMGMADRCQWLGQVPRDAVLQHMRHAHAFVVTSVYDLTSTVVVEALANGLPVICPDHCGFRDAITPECGIRVKASSQRELFAGLRDATIQVYDENLRFRLAQGALARSQHYEWERKARVVNEIYSAKCQVHAGIPSSIPS